MKKIQRIIRLCKVGFGLLAIGLLSCEVHAQDSSSTQQISVNASATGKKKIKIALLLDTSNSMDGLINQAKSQLWTMVNELSKAECNGEKPELQIALYQYGNQSLNVETGYIQQLSGFTGELDEISAKLFGLSTNGGDEYCGWVIQKSIDDLDWGTNESDLKFVFIAGNEPFTQGRVSFTTSCLNARDKDIVVNTIFCGDFNEGINTSWKAGADLARGNYLSINHNAQTVYISTPFDDKLDSLNTRLNTTYIYYGEKGKMKYEQQATQDLKAGTISKENKVERAVSKSSSFYKNESWDLVDKSATTDDLNEMVRVDLDEETLPAEMQGMTDEQKVSYIKQKAVEREKIQTEINDLSAKRQTYIAENSKTKEVNLNSTMTESIKKKAMEKNYSFK
jgi:hypothetical protein